MVGGGLRSEFATIANRSGVDLLNIKEQLSRENLQTTQDCFKIEAAAGRRDSSRFPDLAEDRQAAARRCFRWLDLLPKMGSDPFEDLQYFGVAVRDDSCLLRRRDKEIPFN